MVTLNTTYLYPLVLVFLSGFGFSIQTLFIKILEENGFRVSFEQIFFRGCMQLALSSIFILKNISTDNKTELFGDSAKIKFFLFLRSFLGFLSIGGGLLTVEYLPIADATVLVMQSPLFAAFFSYIFISEPWRHVEMVATVLSLSGIIFIVRPPAVFNMIGINVSTHDTGANNVHMGLLCGIISAASAGGAYTTLRILGTSAKMPWANVSFSQSLGQMVLALPSAYMVGQAVRFDLQPWEWGLVAAGAVVGSLSQFALTIGLQRGKSASATLMRMSDVPFGFLWQVLFTSDVANWFSISGACLVATGVLLVALNPPSSTSATCSESSLVKHNDAFEMSPLLSIKYSAVQQSDRGETTSESVSSIDTCIESFDEEELS